MISKIQRERVGTCRKNFLFQSEIVKKPLTGINKPLFGTASSVKAEVTLPCLLRAEHSAVATSGAPAMSAVGVRCTMASK